MTTTFNETAIKSGKIVVKPPKVIHKLFTLFFHFQELNTLSKKFLLTLYLNRKNESLQKAEPVGLRPLTKRKRSRRTLDRKDYSLT